MKTIWGPPLENPDFHPETGGWHLIQEPDPRVSPFFELPFSLGLGAATFLLLREFHGFLGFPGNLVFAVPLIVVTVVIHEFLHAVGHPGFGFGPETRFGIWISRMAFYSRFEGVLSRNRRLLITILPFLAITCTCVSLLLFSHLYWWPLSFIAFFNSLFSSRDLMNAWIIIRQAPRESILRDNGWKTWWRETTPGPG